MPIIYALTILVIPLLMNKYRSLLKAIGPGILIACTAIGGSHLVWSTRAGAEYGWSLIGVILVANFLKFPFFYFGQHYTATTGESLLFGYKRKGPHYLYTFLIINAMTGTINIAALGMLTASILTYLVGGLSISVAHLTILLIIVMALIILLGQYPILDKLSKWIITTLSFLTIIAVCLAFNGNPPLDPEFIEPNAYSLATMGFIISLLGWMPAPVELSIWPSLWMKDREKQTGHRATPREVAIDFSIGYITTTILACLFLALGALTIYGTNTELSSSGVQYVRQLVELYTQAIGGYVKPIIIIAAFLTMFSTTLNSLDGFPRSLATTLKLLCSSKDAKEPSLSETKKLFQVMIVVYMTTASMIHLFFSTNMIQLLSIAAIVAFLSSPVLAWSNLKVITADNVPQEHQPALWIKITSYVGISAFIIISLLYMYTKFI